MLESGPKVARLQGLLDRPRPRRAIRFVLKGDAGSGKTTFVFLKMFRGSGLGSFEKEATREPHSVARFPPGQRAESGANPDSLEDGYGVHRLVRGGGRRVVRRGARYFVRRGARCFVRRGGR